MPKITLEDLVKISAEIRRTILLREGEAKAKVIVHMGTCGIAAGARLIVSTLMEEVEKLDSTDIIVTISSCAGLCSREPMMTVELQDEPPVKYVDLTPEKAKRILHKHVLGGEIVTEFALASGNERML